MSKNKKPSTFYKSRIFMFAVSFALVGVVATLISLAQSTDGLTASSNWQDGNAYAVKLVWKAPENYSSGQYSVWKITKDGQPLADATDCLGTSFCSYYDKNVNRNQTYTYEVYYQGPDKAPTDKLGHTLSVPTGTSQRSSVAFKVPPVNPPNMQYTIWLEGGGVPGELSSSEAKSVDLTQYGQSIHLRFVNSTAQADSWQTCLVKEALGDQVVGLNPFQFNGSENIKNTNTTYAPTQNGWYKFKLSCGNGVGQWSGARYAKVALAEHTNKPVRDCPQCIPQDEAPVSNDTITPSGNTGTGGAGSSSTLPTGGASGSPTDESQDEDYYERPSSGDDPYERPTSSSGETTTTIRCASSWNLFGRLFGWITGRCPRF